MPDFQKKHCRSSCDAVLAGPAFASSINQSDCQKVDSPFQNGVKETFTTDKVKMDESMPTEFMNFEKLACGTARRCFDLNENTYDDISNDGANIDHHMTAKRQHTCSFSEPMPFSTKKQTSNIGHLHSSLKDNPACSVTSHLMHNYFNLLFNFVFLSSL